MASILNRIRRKIIRLTASPVKYAKIVGVSFGNDLHIYGTIHWGSEPWIITLGNNVHLTDGVSFLTHDAGILIFKKDIPDLELTKPITVGDDVYIGANTMILGGVTIGNKVIIGCGSVVTRDIPDNSVAVGSPARVIKSADEYLEKAKTNSIHLGHLYGQAKDKALMEYYHYTGDSRGFIFNIQQRRQS